MSPPLEEGWPLGVALDIAGRILLVPGSKGLDWRASAKLPRIEALSTMQGQDIKRAPKRAIENLVGNGALNEIGGTLQIGTASPADFGLKSYVRPLVVGKPHAARYFLGIDIDQEIGPVGHPHYRHEWDDISNKRAAIEGAAPAKQARSSLPLKIK